MSNVESNTWKARVLAAMAFEREERDRRWRDCGVRAAAAHDAVVALLDEAVAHWDAAPADPQPVAMPEVLARLEEWTHVHGAALIPGGWADSFGDGMRVAKVQVASIISSAAIDRAAAKVSQEPAVDRSELRERIVDLLCEWVKDVPSKSDLTSSGDIADRILALPGIVPPAAAQDARLRRAALAVLAKWQEKGPFSPIGEMSALALALGHEQPAHERDDAAWAREAAPAPAAPAPYEINFDEVICPACCHQFRAIPVNVQRELNALRDMDEKAQGDEKLRRLKDEFALRGASIGFEDGYRLCCSHVVREVNDLLAETPAKPDVPPEPTCDQCRNWSRR